MALLKRLAALHAASEREGIPVDELQGRAREHRRALRADC